LSFQRLLPPVQVWLAQFIYGFLIRFGGLSAALRPADQLEIPVILQQQIKKFLRGSTEDAVHTVAGIAVPAYPNVAAPAWKDFFLRVLPQVITKHSQDICFTSFLFVVFGS